MIAARGAAPALARAVAVLAACLVATGCARSAPFDARTGAVRLGRPADQLRVAGVSRPIVEQQDGRVSVEIPATGSRTLELAAAPAQSPGGIAAKSHRCRATFVAQASSPPVVRELLVGGEPRWSEFLVPIPGAPQGGTLTLACDEPKSVAWAQPLLLPPAGAGAAPLIVVLSLDTLRADHVTGFGDPEVPTPALAAIAKEGIALTSAVSTYTWTLPSHFSLFYSHLYGFPPTTPSVAGLAGTLSDAGFATAGFTGGGFVGADFHFDAGFDRYAEYNASSAGVADIDSLPGLLADAGRWIEEREATPSFVFLHTYAVHEVPPAEQKKRGFGPLALAVEYTAEDVDAARAFYGRLVGRVDEALAPFFADLRATAGQRPTMLVVLSDHGEAFREHGNFRHGSSGSSVTLHDEVTHIPMVFWAPGIVPADRVSTYPFSLLDVAPTILAATGIAAPPGMVGRDFWPLLHGQWGRLVARYRSRWDEPVVSYKDGGLDAPASWSTRTASLKRIVDRPRHPGPEDVELYELAGDPGERVNLADRDRAGTLATAVDELKELLPHLGVGAADPGEVLPACPACKWESFSEFWSRLPLRSGDGSGRGAAESTLDPETRKRLEALGYLN